MKILKTSDIDEIINLLNNDGVVAIPTDTIYGFSCLATSDIAINKLCSIKACDDQKLFIILLSKDYDLSEVIEGEHNQKFVKDHTPNPVTFIVNKLNKLNLSYKFFLPTLAIRIPDDDFLQSILNKVGYMISTSANIHGEPNINDYTIIEKKFTSLDGVVESDTKNNVASTIVDLTVNPYKIIRQGDFKLEDLI